MAWIATAAVISAGASLYGSSQQADAADEAAQRTSDATNRATESQERMFNTTREDMAPWRDVGKEGLYSLADLMGIQSTDSSGNLRPQSDRFGTLGRTFTMSDFYKDPGYDFRLNEGLKGIDRGAAARGDFFSGATGKALSEYNQNYASNEFNNAYNRFNTDQSNLYNRYAGLSGTGQATAGQIGSLGANTYSNIANTSMTGANSVSDAYMNAANARASGYAGVGNAITSGVGNYMAYNARNSGYGGYGSGYGSAYPTDDYQYNLSGAYSPF